MLITLGELRLRAPLEDALAAAAVTLARGVSPTAVCEALAGFRGVAHRLEELGAVGGVTYVNDSKATNVASTLAALHSFEPGSILLILGGQGKSQDFAPLRAPIAERVAHTYLIGQDAPLIEAALSGLPYSRVEMLEQAVALAAGHAQPGQVILLSPACASFDQFENFEARGEAFRALMPRQA